MIGERGKALVREAEGLRLEAYLCPAGKWTIGYGHTKGVQPGDRCTEAEAEVLLEQDLAEAEAVLARWVDVPLTDAMRDALASWVFNLGGGKFRISTLLRRLNAFDYPAVPAEIRRWVWAKNPETNELVELPGLVTRRAAEADLFMADGLPKP